MPSLSKQRATFFCSVCFALSASGDSVVPSVEFWRYFAEYSDSSGELFDPADLEAAHNLANQNEKTMHPKPPSEQQPLSEEDDNE